MGNIRVKNSLDDCYKKVDAVSILTPPSTHRQLCLNAIALGKPILCEKPLPISIEDAQVIAKMCGMSIESLPHDIDMIRWIAGEIESVKAYTNESITELPGFDDNANVVMKLKNGAIAAIHASWSSHIGMNARGMIGSKGTAMVEGRSIWDIERFRLKTADMEYEQMEMIEDTLDIFSYLEKVRHFASCIEKDEQPLTTAMDGLMAVEISQAILSSSKTNETILINHAQLY